MSGQSRKCQCCKQEFVSAINKSVQSSVAARKCKKKKNIIKSFIYLAFGAGKKSANISYKSPIGMFGAKVVNKDMIARQFPARRRGNGR